jgi:hypothetical protein
MTIIILILVGILLAHVLADTVKAAVVVLIVAAVFYLSRGVSFEALVDDGARSLFDSTQCHVEHRHGERI